MRTVKKDPTTGLPEKYLSGSKNRAKRAEVINEGKEAYEKGKKLPDEYFDKRMEYEDGGKVSAKPLSESTKKTLREKAKSSGKSYETLKKVYRRGQGAWLSSGSRTGASMAAWAMGRVNSFIKGSKKHDTDL